VLVHLTHIQRSCRAWARWRGRARHTRPGSDAHALPLSPRRCAHHAFACSLCGGMSLDFDATPTWHPLARPRLSHGVCCAALPMPMTPLAASAAPPRHSLARAWWSRCVFLGCSGELFPKVLSDRGIVPGVKPHLKVRVYERAAAASLFCSCAAHAWFLLLPRQSLLHATLPVRQTPALADSGTPTALSRLHALPARLQPERHPASAPAFLRTVSCQSVQTVRCHPCGQ
jgi:hypothetical protein